ncbi:cholecystokinin receptor-like [Patiria miniata]|uniref:G-protein coupled receptors family 1 profile domain-containing protein n=1 Tax=Patiria miniata TaxID=46514 RepID=A0A914BLY0_PATMI|nr:cholecystokinin receptor-like [Patiria miniata]
MAEALLSLRIIKTIIGLLGIFNNGLVIVVIAKVDFMHSMTNAFICHQAIIDFIGSLLLFLQSNIPIPTPVPETAAGELLCRVWIGDALLWLLFATSTFNLLGLTLERYIAIVFPFRYHCFFSRRPATLMFIFSWVIGLLLKSYSFIIYTVVEGVCKFQRVSVSHVMGPLLIVLQYFIPAGVMLFCYIHITISLKRGALRVAPVPAPLSLKTAPSGVTASTATSGIDAAGSIDPGASSAVKAEDPEAGSSTHRHPVNDQQDSLLRARRNTFKTLVIVFAVFLICWSPSQITFFMFNLGWLKLDFSGPLNVFSTFMVAANCCVNPIIYCIKYKQFQRGVRYLFCGRRERDQFPRP